MTKEIGAESQSSLNDKGGVRRRGLLRLGTLATAITGVSALSGLGASRAQAALQPTSGRMPTAPPSATYIPTAEKGAASGVATLDSGSKVSPAQIPDLSTAYASYITPQKFGALGDGVSDDTVAIQEAFSAAGASNSGSTVSVYKTATLQQLHPTIYFKSGTYLISSQLAWPQGVNIILDHAAVIKATAKMPAMLATDKTVLHQRERIQGGIFDCDNLASIGISIGYFAHMSVSDVTIYRAGLHGLVLGDPAAPSPSYEAIVTDLDVWRPRDATPPFGGYGLWLRYATDSVLTRAHLMGVETGTRADMPSSVFENCHVWNSSSAGAGPVTCFDDNTYGSVYVGCYADSPSLYGFRIRNGHVQIQSCRASLTPSLNPDNTLIGIYSDQATGCGAFTIFGFRLDGGDATHRWKTEIASSDMKNVDYLGVFCSSGFIASSIGNRGRLRGLYLENPTPTSAALILHSSASNGTGDLVQAQRFDTQNAGRFTASGGFQLPAFSTANRPSASMFAYQTIFDTTIGLPIVSDGSTWKDYSGTAR